MIVKRILCTLIGFALLFLLCNCSNAITEGEVYKKEFRAAHTKTSIRPLVVLSDGTVSTVMVPYVKYYPDQYVIFIRAYQDDEWKTEDFYVSEEVYDRLNIGDMFLYDEGRGDLTDEPYTQERKTD